MAKVKVVSDSGIKPKALAKELLPAGASNKEVLALRDKIVDGRTAGVVKGQKIASGTVVKVGKTIAPKTFSGTLTDKSTTNRFEGLGKLAATPMGNVAIGASSVASDVPAAAIKTAPIDTVEFVDESLSAELLLDLLFEDVGGQELLTIARNDTVNGQDVVYQPFKNLGILQEIYNPTNLLKLQETSDKIFSNFTINLRDKIPKVGSGLNGANYYLDLAAGDGIIEFINLKSDEQVEVQIVSAGIIEDVGI
jgi:hypothetical protein